MISVEEASEFVPHGRLVVSKHPRGLFGDSPCGAEAEAESEERWEAGPGAGDELYTRGRTVVWSVGRRTHKCYSLSEPVLQTLRVTFYTEPSARPGPRAGPVQEEPGGQALPSIVARDRGVLRVFTEQGQDFRVALQFPVRQCWATRFGLLIERAAPQGDRESETEDGETTPVLFSLLHPLDDLTREVARQAGRLAEWRDHRHTVVFTASAPSIAVSYDQDTEQHSVWQLRRATQQEAERAVYLEAGSGEPEGSLQAPGSDSRTPGSSRESRLLSHSPAWLLSSSSLHGSPLRSLPASRSATPGPSRQGSPLAGRAGGSPGLTAMASLLRGGQSPTVAGRAAALRLASPARSPYRPQEPDLSLEEARPVPVEVTMCLDHLWTEQAGVEGGRAEKVFLAGDCVGQQMICLLQSGALSMVRMERTNDGGGKVIFGAPRRVAALDAAPVEGLQMVLVLDPAGGLTLYSGATRIARVSLPAGPALPALALSRDISALALDSRPGTPLPARLASPPPHLDLASAPATPLSHKRSSLLTSSRPPSAALPSFGEDSSLGLSPVAAGCPGEAGRVTALLGPRDRRITLAYSSGRLVQVEVLF
jgi:hypothetical protein